MTPVEEYVSRFIERGEKPVCEYVDGVLIAKSAGTKQRSQAALNRLPELTARIRDTQFYVPDLAVKEIANPIQGRYPGPSDPVLLRVEIVSPADRVGRLFFECEEYHAWGVAYCWVINPERKIAWEYFEADLEPRRVDEKLSAGAIELVLEDVSRRV